MAGSKPKVRRTGKRTAVGTPIRRGIRRVAKRTELKQRRGFGATRVR